MAYVVRVVGLSDLVALLTEVVGLSDLAALLLVAAAMGELAALLPVVAALGDLAALQLEVVEGHMGSSNLERPLLQMCFDEVDRKIVCCGESGRHELLFVLSISC